jgi:hypothetical protein
MDERKWLIPENTVHNLTTISNLLRIVFWRGDRPGPDILRFLKLQAFVTADNAGTTTQSTRPEIKYHIGLWKIQDERGAH